MLYVNSFLQQKGIPGDLKRKINRYLDYNWELKKQIKIDEEEVRSLLNKDLLDKITVFLNGRLLASVEIFENFKIEFLSELAFLFQKKSFSLDDNILYENEVGNEIFFLT